MNRVRTIRQRWATAAVAGRPRRAFHFPALRHCQATPFALAHHYHHQQCAWRRTFATAADIQPRAQSQPHSQAQPTKSPYSATLQLPVTTFPSHWNSQREVALLDRCCARLYEAQQYQPLVQPDGTLSHNPPTFRLHDGPPFANGKLHTGHFLNKVLKDVIIRHALLTGHRVEYVPGWDCHGLPIESKALDSIKTTNTSMSTMEVRTLARQYASEAIVEQKREFQRYGVMGDWQLHYSTMSPTFEQSQLAVFATMVSKGLIYRGLKPVSWSPASRTALAEAELEYNDEHVSPSVHVMFPLTHLSSTLPTTGTDTVYALIWTTTPWTLPANQAIAYHPQLSYSLVRVGQLLPQSDTDEPLKKEETVLENRLLLVGSKRVAAIEKLIGRELTVIDTVKGEQLQGTRYKHPFIDRQSPFIPATHVTTDSGTALVHTAPAHGGDDFVACRDNDITDILGLVDDSGMFTSDAGDDLIGQPVLTQGNETVISKLRQSRALFHFTRIQHRYPYDWRSKTPIIQRATQQWFARIDTLQNDALKAIDTIEFVPESGRSRLSAMIGNRKEWCLSRQRVWGLPIPVFYDTDSGEPLLTVDSINHVAGLIGQHGSDYWFTAPIEELLAPPYRDNGHRYHRGVDTIDVWFDSGSSWAHQFFDSDTVYDVYLEGSDQHRGWFQSSLLLSMAVRGIAPCRAIVTHGFVLDEQQRKMSKSLGNIIEPKQLIEPSSTTVTANANTALMSKRAQKRIAQSSNTSNALGADILRYWVCSTDYVNDASIGPAVLSKVTEVHRKLRSSLRFMLGCLDDFTVDDRLSVEQMSLIDRSMIHQLQSLKRRIDDSYRRYDFSDVYSALLTFNNHALSAFYFDTGKDRLYVDGRVSDSRRSCQTVLALALEVLLKASAPFVPFTAEDVWEHCPPNIRALLTPHSQITAESVFLTGWIRDTSLTVEQQSLLVKAYHTVEAGKKIKGEISKLLEVSRKAGTIGSAVDAEVRIFIDTGAESQWLRDAISELGNDLNVMLVVSATSVSFVDNISDALTSAASGMTNDSAPVCGEFSVADTSDSNSISMGAIVSRAGGCKCPRCWKYHRTELSEHQLCDRCSSVLSMQ